MRLRVPYFVPCKRTFERNFHQLQIASEEYQARGFELVENLQLWQGPRRGVGGSGKILEIWKCRTASNEFKIESRKKGRTSMGGET